jgi:hypothetical protein
VLVACVLFAMLVFTARLVVAVSVTQETKPGKVYQQDEGEPVIVDNAADPAPTITPTPTLTLTYTLAVTGTATSAPAPAQPAATAALKLPMVLKQFPPPTPTPTPTPTPVPPHWQWQRGELIMNDVDFSDASHGWAVGPYGMIVYSENAGQTWRSQ